MASSQDKPPYQARKSTEEQVNTQRQPMGANDTTQGQGVRFSSVLQEIEPQHSLHTGPALIQNDSRSTEPLSPEAQEEIRNLSKSLQQSHLEHRMTNSFAFEPVSLPVSRAPSNDSSPRYQTRDERRSGAPSPRASPVTSSMHTPPLTPAVSASRDGHHAASTAPGLHSAKPHFDPVQMTPQTSGPQKILPPTTPESTSNSTGQTSTQPSSVLQGSNIITGTRKQASVFIPGPAGDSVPASREESPTGSPGSPGRTSGTATPPAAYPRPFTPAGDRDDPYARSKRPPQSRNLDAIDARFIFGGLGSRGQSTISTTTGPMGSLPRSSSGTDLKSDKHQSGFSLHSLAGKKDHHGHLHEDGAPGVGKTHGSMSDLKRFLRIGHSKEKRSQSPAKSTKSLLNKSGTRTPPHQLPPSHVPFADDHGLESKYGKFGKVLGSGAGGSVRLMKRSSDGVTFAVKQFRDRHSYETEREYSKKVTAEFCIGSTLHHGNIIETLDIIQERGHWYEVMEYAPYDLFAIVMTGKMSREEVACSFLQIVAGVTYLHSMGLAHRDLKLDNVVVNEHGIMKLIDFGSATVFRYPFENDIVLATGVVGSDPYLAPEVYDNARYDPQPTDIWSLAIIFACMSLRRFPWKAPRISDNSYKLFISPPTPGTPPAEGNLRRVSEQRPKSTVEIAAVGDESRRRSAPHPEGPSYHFSDEATNKQPHHHHNQNDQSERSLADQDAAAENHRPDPAGPRIDAQNGKQEVIRGPWRLLRLLPRESRTIIGRMLDINPKKRATLEEILDDPWVNSTPVCRQLEGCQIVNALGHVHTLEPSTPDPPPVKK